LGVHAHQTEAGIGGCANIVSLKFEEQGVGPPSYNSFVLQSSVRVKGLKLTSYFERLRAE
jgi:hypothetical protein